MSIMALQSTLESGKKSRAISVAVPLYFYSAELL